MRKKYLSQLIELNIFGKQDEARKLASANYSSFDFFCGAS
jgi:hypothetical protein